ncbi:endonuclease/exonuclease/phosphatase family protein [Aequorivita xiaoshiensis]|uniref:Endonuclease/exonuclease/phosphatase family protein n=1 Tax=Aequorivita xiaoshiensis TaxID=2874476 RepID=A0A9X1R6G6_9FLAO|nr:endonuclease/exonuclease/phosphatase family protein [Aequorivita xiaoshiensis]MCG2431859.1 endonuclease/exonuclease/phosphatase family protein [Aequorivita xiaoshiensis]
MKKLKNVLKFLLYTIALLIAVFSILSIFRDTENRILKMMDFPRIQFFIISVFCLILILSVVKKWRWYKYLILLFIISGIVVNGSYIINYTPLVAEIVPTSKTLSSTDAQISLLLTNVKMSNRNSQKLISIINQRDPDLILAMEVDSWWDNNLDIFVNDYPFSQKVILDNTYGMILYSKLPFLEKEIYYLNNENVPSFESTILLNNGKRLSLFCMHPVPPTHFKKLPDNAGQKEKALMKMGAMINKRKYPTVVAGDLNDVVWSNVDKLTNTKSILYDVRVGRGFFNNFNAENFLMRWPLDHVFVTDEFSVKKLERLSDIGSDHFPMYIELVLEGQ